MNKTITTSQYQEMVKWLREGRISAGLTMRELGARLGVPHTFVHKTETLERRLDIAEFVTYCDALGLSPAEGIELLRKKPVIVPSRSWDY
ncbi:MAG: helix-turn-helix transcriptional regulator [Natronospirillum sp.]